MSVEAKRVMEAPLGRAPRSFWFFFARFGGGGGMRKRARLMVLTVPLYTAIGRITTALDDDDDDAADDDADADADAETIVRLLSLYRVAIVLQYRIPKVSKIWRNLSFIQRKTTT